MITLKHAMYQFPSGTCIGPFDLDVSAGELVVLTGPSGCGKSTILRVCAGLAARQGHGVVRGTVLIDGRDPGAIVAADRVCTVGFVGQDPDDSVVCADVAAEVAFSLENVGEGTERVHHRVREVLALVGLVGLDGADPRRLSGGQRQRLAIGAAVAAGARVLLLDEPLAHLDPEGAADVMRTLRGLADAGTAVLLVEHRLEAAGRFADRTVHMVGGHMAVGAPAPTRPPLSAVPEPTTLVLSAPAVSAAWGIADATLAVHAGERIAIVGHNGGGKSTLLQLLARELRPTNGRVTGAAALLVPQNPDLGLFAETVDDEIGYAPTESGRTDVAARVAALRAAMRLDGLGARSPHALSRGQRLRVAVAAALASEPAVLLLDEPTSGQDAGAIDAIFACIAPLPCAVIFATHDRALVAREATRAILIEDGRIVMDASPSAVLAVATTRAPKAHPEIPVRAPVEARMAVALLVATGVLALTLEAPLALGVVAAICVTLAMVQPRMDGWRWPLVAGLALLSWSTAFSQALFYADLPRTPIPIGPITLWKEGFLHGLVQSLRFTAVTAAGLAVALGVPSEDLALVLQRLRVPWGLALMATTSLRFLPVVGAEVVASRRARARRGRSVWRRTPWNWAIQEGNLLRPVAARCIRRAQALAETLDARGFHPSSPRTTARVSSMSTLAAAVAGSAMFGALAIAAARVLYLLYGADILYVPGLRPLYAFVRAWM